MGVTAEMRCDANPSKLFGKVKVGEIPPPMLAEGNLIEFSCRECRRALEEREGRRPEVFHRFNVMGELVETEVVWP